VFGAIDFAAAVARIGTFLGYRVTVCDARPVFATASGSRRPTRRRAAGPAARPGPGAPSAREAMVSCAQCGLHLPSGEALPGRGGVFCSEGHRAAYEKEHAPK